MKNTNIMAQCICYFRQRLILNRLTMCFLLLMCFPMEVEAGRVIQIDLDDIVEVRSIDSDEGMPDILKTNRVTFKKNAKEGKCIDIEFVKDGVSYSMNTHFHTHVRENLYKYVEEGPVEPFDSYNFIHFLYGFDCGTHSRDYEKNWETSLIDTEKELRIGDCIGLCKNINEDTFRPQHFALYLGEGLYYSKFGSEGATLVTTLSEMKRCYIAESLYRLRPKVSI